MFDVYYKDEEQFENILGGANNNELCYSGRRKEPKKVYDVVYDAKNQPMFLVFDSDTWKLVSASEFVPPNNNF